MRAIALLGLAVGASTAFYGLSARTPAEDLDHALAGRVAGPTVSCVSLRDLRGNRSVGAAIVFGEEGRRLYVNRPPVPCPSLGGGRTLVVHPSTDQLCRGDIAVIADSTSGIQIGACGLGDFTPYDPPPRR